MLNISPVNIFPLKYPKLDLSLPPHGVKAIPVTLIFSDPYGTLLDTSYLVDLLSIQEQKNFDSLRSIWIDATNCPTDIRVDIDGTTQSLIITAGSTGYYDVIVLNNPKILFTLLPNGIIYNGGYSLITSLNVIFLNYSPQNQSGYTAQRITKTFHATLTSTVTISQFQDEFGTAAAPTAIKSVNIQVGGAIRSPATINTLYITSNSGYRLSSYGVAISPSSNSTFSAIYESGELFTPIDPSLTGNLKATLAFPLTGGFLTVNMTAI